MNLAHPYTHMYTPLTPLTHTPHKVGTAVRAALRDAGHDVGVAGAVRAAGDLLLEAVEGLSDPHVAATAGAAEAAPRAPEAMLRHGALGRWVSLRRVLKYMNTPISPY